VVGTGLALWLIAAVAAGAAQAAGAAWAAPAATPSASPAAKPPGDTPWPLEPPPPPAPTWKTVGYSVRGRPIKVIVFGDGPRRLLIIAGTHGNESGPPVATAFVRWLLRHPGAVPDDAQIHIIRCQNPDGRAAWTRGNARRVDLNRNYPASTWTRRLDPRDPSAWMGLWGGSRPGSEPETRTVLRYLRRQGFDRLVTLHSRAGLLDWNGPGGKRLAWRMSRLCGLPLGHLSYQPYIHGSLGQFFPERYGKATVTVELLSGTLTRGLRRALLAAAR
jgi:predicted deacylase